jgi:hypothetical protein
VAPMPAWSPRCASSAGQVVAEGQPVLSLARDGEREIVANCPRSGSGRCARSPPRPPWHQNDQRRRAAGAARSSRRWPARKGRTFRVRYARAGIGRAGRRSAAGQHMQLNLSGPPSGPATTAVPVTATGEGQRLGGASG